MINDVFISYSHHDKKIADALCHYLEQNNIKCWIAPRDINSGEEYGEVIERAICNSRIFLLLYSKDSSVSPWVKGELNIAFSEEKYIAPVRIDNTTIEGSNRLILNQMHWIDVFPYVERNFSVVKNSIKTLLVNTPDNDPTENDVKKWDWSNFFVKNKKRTFCLIFLILLVALGGKFLVCLLCSFAAQVGLWIEPLNLDTENMNLPDTAMVLWLPTFIILTLIFIAQGFKRKSISKLVIATVFSLTCINCVYVGSHSLWFYGLQYSEGLWIFEKDGNFMSDNSHYGARNIFGIVVISPIYEKLRGFEDGYSVAKKDGYWGAIDKNQKTIVPFQYVNYSEVVNFLYGIPFEEF